MTGTRIRYIIELIVLVSLVTVYWFYFKPYSPDVSGFWTPTGGPSDTEVRSLLWSKRTGMLIAGSRISDTSTGLAFFRPGTNKWTPIETGLSLNHVFVDLLETNDEIWAVYFATAEKPGGILAGHPGKHDWRRLIIEGQPEPRCVTAMDRAFKSFLLGTVKDGIFRSDDSGKTWKPVGEGLKNKRIQCLCPDPVSPATVYAGTLNGMYRSDDAGLTWKQVQPSLFHEMLIVSIIADETERGDFYAVAKNRDGFTKIYLKTRKSALWKPLTEGLSEYSQPRVLLIPPDSKNHIFMGSVWDGAYVYDKSYNLWSAINDGFPTMNIGKTTSKLIKAGKLPDVVINGAPVKNKPVIIHSLAYMPGKHPILFAGTDLHGTVWQFKLD